MSDTVSPVLALPYIQPSQAQKHVTHNEALRQLDVLVQLAVASRSVAAAPLAPPVGTRHIVPAGGSGAFAGQDGQIALFEGPGWRFVAPAPGWQAHVLDEGLGVVFDGSAWAALAGGGTPAQLPQLGINTAADGTNRLAVAAAATLLSHDGAGHQLKLNKAAGGDTASLLFQTGWSGRAEMGTAGGDDFAIKVSADGSAWATGLSIDAASGAVHLPGDVQIAGAVSGSGVVQDPADSTAGRLAVVGWMGLGGTLPELDAGDDLSALGATCLFGVPDGGDRPAGQPGDPAQAAGLNLAVAGGARAQMVVTLDGSGDLWLRVQAGTWQDWARAVTSANMVGPVSQSGGAPTGAVVESGSNANGSYTRWADGTQIATNDNAPITTAPAAFAGPITKIDGDKMWIGRWF